MADQYLAELSDAQKLSIVSNFIVHSPPGEFNEVFNDTRVLLDNDGLLREGAKESFAKYNKEQFTPCMLEGENESCLITDHAELGENRFYDPKSKLSFRYDHLRKEASDVQQHQTDESAESWRSSLENNLTQYLKNHYKYGICSVYGSSSSGNITLIVCIESHQFQPKNFWNGKWRSQWSVTFPASGGSSAELTGTLKVQVHYYEDGNVQLVSSKQITANIKCNDEQSLSKDFISAMGKAEDEYESAISENYRTMSDTTFKALRRNLPVTRTRVDWNKILGYKVGRDLKNA